MEKDYKKEIEQLVGQLECGKGFICYKSGLEVLCKAKDIGLKSHLVCLERNGHECSFSLPFGSSYYCKCPVRVYIAKKLKK